MGKATETRKTHPPFSHNHNITYLLKCSKNMRLVEVPMMVVSPPMVAA